MNALEYVNGLTRAIWKKFRIHRQFDSRQFVSLFYPGSLFFQSCRYWFWLWFDVQMKLICFQLTNQHEKFSITSFEQCIHSVAQRRTAFSNRKQKTIQLTCSLSNDLNNRIFLTDSTKRDLCSSLFGKMAAAPSSSSGSFSGSYVSANTDLRLVAKRLTSGSEREGYNIRKRKKILEREEKSEWQGSQTTSKKTQHSFHYFHGWRDSYRYFAVTVKTWEKLWTFR